MQGGAKAWAAAAGRELEKGMPFRIAPRPGLGQARGALWFSQ